MFTDPQNNVKEFGFLPGEIIADLGSGSGHYAMRLSEAVGPNGGVYCVDINKDSLVALKNQAEREGRRNIEVILGDMEKLGGTKLKDAVVDGTLFSNVLLQLDNKSEAIKEAKRILKPGGKLCIVEWSDLSYTSGVKKDGKKVVVSKDEMIRLVEANGFKLEKSFEAGDHHYGLIFKN